MDIPSEPKASEGEKEGSRGGKGLSLYISFGRGKRKRKRARVRDEELRRANRDMSLK